MNANVEVTLATDLLQRGHTIQTNVFFRIAHPLIGESDSLAIAPVQPTTAARLVGRLVAVNFGKSFIVQRVVGRDAAGGQVYIKSDLTRNAPTAVPLQTVVGQVTEVRKASCALRLEGRAGRAFGRMVAALSIRLVDREGLPVAIGTARRRFFRSIIKLLFAIQWQVCKRSLSPPHPLAH